jgi:7,8-dihydro-6-hydroxymethylpterin-pyrophosphokinase
MDNIAYIGIGSNQGDPLTNCTVAIEHICASGPNRLLEQSSFYHTEPWGYRDQDDFINLVIKIKTSLSPFDLLSFLQGVESSQLTIPHSFVCQRGFVLHPLEEISPHLIHPVYQQTISQLLDSLDDDKRVIKLAKERT